jgi:hypothetical protein
MDNMKSKDWEAFLESEWPLHRRETTEAMRKIDEIHVAIGAIKNDTRHLQMLDSIAKILGDVRDSLLPVLIGKDIMSTTSAKEMLEAQQKTYGSIITSLCKIFSIVVLLLVGMRIWLPEILK